MKSYVHPYNRYHLNCLQGVGDGSGNLALPMSLSDPTAHGSLLEFVSSTGGNFLQEQDVSSEGPSPIQQPAGVVVFGEPGHLYPFNPALKITSFASAGGKSGESTFSADHYAGASDPAGGLFLAGDLGTGPSAARVHSAAMFSGGGTSPTRRWGPTPLASTGMVFGAGRHFQIARGGRAYAAVPYGALGTCNQRLEIVAPDGTSCGATNYPIASGTCTTKDLTVGADGTVIQQLPDAMETFEPVNGQHSCTWRFWAAAAK